MNESQISLKKETKLASEEVSFDGESPLVRYKDKSLTNLLLKTAGGGSGSSKGSSEASTPASNLLKLNRPFTQIAEEQTLENNLSTQRKRDSLAGAGDRKMERIRDVIIHEYEGRKSRFSQISENAMATVNGDNDGDGNFKTNIKTDSA